MDFSQQRVFLPFPLLVVVSLPESLHVDVISKQSARHHWQGLSDFVTKDNYLYQRPKRVVAYLYLSLVVFIPNYCEAA